MMSQVHPPANKEEMEEFSFEDAQRLAALLEPLHVDDELSVATDSQAQVNSANSVQQPELGIHKSRALSNGIGKSEGYIEKNGTGQEMHGKASEDTQQDVDPEREREEQEARAQCD
jgi:hypothetical protein